jgi:hypothetical protein
MIRGCSVDSVAGTIAAKAGNIARAHASAGLKGGNVARADAGVGSGAGKIVLT